MHRNLFWAGSLWLIFGVGCAADPAEPGVISGQRERPAADLVELAMATRAMGGRVFVAEVASLTPLEPIRTDVVVVADLFFEHSPFRATLTVSDALGSDVGGTLDIVGARESGRLVDADGNVAQDWVISGQPLPQELLPAPTSGSFVFFVIPSGGDWHLKWAATTHDETVDGTGTVSGLEVAVDALLDLPACSEMPVYVVAGLPSSGSVPRIMASPEAPLEFAPTTPLAVEIVAGALVLRLSVRGEALDLTVPDVDVAPALVIGEPITVSLQVDRTGGIARLALFDTAGPIAAYVRGGRIGSSRAEVGLLARLTGLPLAATPACRVEGAGQCGRAALIYDVVVGDARVSQGETASVSGSMSLRSVALADDADSSPPGGCVIGTYVTAELDLVRR